MHHATSWDAICLIAVLIFLANVLEKIIHRAGPSYRDLATRVAELEAERDKMRSALRPLVDAASADLRMYAALLDDQWPRWREFADQQKASGS